MAYHPGMLNRYVDLQERAVLTDDFGEAVGAWQLRRSLWAAKLPIRASEFLQADQFRSDVQFKFVVRAQPGLSIQPTWRIVEGGLIYRISGVLPTQDRVWLQIMCSAGSVSEVAP